MSSYTIEKFQKKILNQIEEGKINFFVGAGISKEFPSKLQGGPELTELLLEKWVSDSDAKKKLNTYAKMGTLRLEVLMQKSVETFSNKDIIQNPLLSLLNTSPNNHHYFLAYALKKGCTIITTNFDILIEAAYWNLYGSLPKMIIDENQFKNADSSGAIIKLHGSIGLLKIDKKTVLIHDTRDTIIASLKQVAQGLGDKKTALFENVIHQYPTLFLGYSCMDDFDIFPVLISNRSLGRHLFYWVYFKNNVDLNPISEAEWNKLASEIYSNSNLEDPKRFKISNMSAILTSRDFRLIGNMSPWVNEAVKKIWDIEPKRGFEAQLCSSISNFLNVQTKDQVPQPETWEMNLLTARLLVQVEERGNEVDQLYSMVYNSEIRDRDFRMKLRIDHAEAKTPLDPIKAQDIISSGLINQEGISENTRATALMILSNIKRRQKVIRDSSEFMHEALKIAEYGKINAETRHLILHYHGLIIHQEVAEEVKQLKKDKNHASALMKKITDCEQQFLESSDFFKNGGNISEYTMSQNALGLLLIEKGNALKILDKNDDSNVVYENAATILKNNVAKIRTKYGFFRGVGQAYRNIALVRQSQGDYPKALLALDRSIIFYSMVKPIPPESDLFEVLFRQAEIYIKLDQPEPALQPIIRWIIQKRAASDWHDEARGLKLLAEAQQKLDHSLDAGYTIKIILNIYRHMLSDETNRQKLKDRRFGVENAKEILFFSESLAKKIMRSDYEQEASSLLKIIGTI